MIRRRSTISLLLCSLRQKSFSIRIARRVLLIFGALSGVVLLFDAMPSATSPSVAINHQSKSPWRTCCRTPTDSQDICGLTTCSKPCPARPYFGISQEGNNKSHVLFFETYGAGELNVRQACTVESFARLNPNMDVFVLFVDGDMKEEVSTLQVLRAEFPNIHLIRIDSEKFIAGTPLDKWFFCSKWREGPFDVAHLSDALRLLALSLYGGYYFDLDIVFVRPLPAQLKNFIVAETAFNVANGVLHFDRNHPFVLSALNNFKDNYRRFSWGHNGPILLSRMLGTWCDLKDMPTEPALEDLSRSPDISMTCGQDASRKAIKILHPKTFFPLSFGEWKRYFDDPPDFEDLNDERLIGVHVWNKLSAKYTVNKSSDSLFANLARNFCPKIFSIASNGL